MNNSSDCATLAVRRCHPLASCQAARVNGLPPSTIKFPPRSRYRRIESQSASGQADPYGITNRSVSPRDSESPRSAASTNEASPNAARSPASPGAAESAAGNPGCQNTTVFANEVVAKEPARSKRKRRSVRRSSMGLGLSARANMRDNDITRPRSRTLRPAIRNLTKENYCGFWSCGLSSGGFGAGV